jgi:hypothetical protein
MSYAYVIVASLKTEPDAQLHLGDDVLVERVAIGVRRVPNPKEQVG